MPNVEPPKLSLVERILKFNEEIFAYEDEQVSLLKENIIPVFATLQKAFNIPDNTEALNESLDYMMEAESKEELQLYKESFLAALVAVKVEEVLLVDPVLQAAEEFMNVFRLKLSNVDQQLGFINSILDKVNAEVQKVKKDAERIVLEFKEQIEKNEIKIVGLKPENDKDAAEIKRLLELNVKYKEGIKNVEEKVELANTLYDILAKNKLAASDLEYQKIRDEYAVAAMNLQSKNAMTSAYNFFIRKAKESVEKLAGARTVYLRSEASIARGENFDAFTQIAGHVVPVFLPEMLSSVNTFTELAFESSGIKHHVIDNERIPVRLGQRATESPAAPNTWKSNLKKGFAILSGAVQLFGAALLFVSVVGIPFGIMVATHAITMVSIAVGADNYLDELVEIEKRNNNVIRRITHLERLHNDIAAEKVKSHSLLVMPNQQKIQVKKPLTSEAKIDTLLIGDKLSHDLTAGETLKKLKNDFAKSRKSTTQAEETSTILSDPSKDVAHAASLLTAGLVTDHFKGHTPEMPKPAVENKAALDLVNTASIVKTPVIGIDKVNAEHKVAEVQPRKATQEVTSNPSTIEIKQEKVASPVIGTENGAPQIETQHTPKNENSVETPIAGSKDQPDPAIEQHQHPHHQ